jgi:hypothetical protein
VAGVLGVGRSALMPFRFSSKTVIKGGKMKHNFSVILLAALFIPPCLITITTAQNSQTALAAKPIDSVLRKDSINNDVKFEYQVVAKQCNDAFFETKNAHSIVKNVVNVLFTRGGGACTYVCRLVKKEDTLDISTSCDPGSEQLHKRCVCVYCKLSGLKKGVYYLNYGEGYKKITIK